MVGYGPLLTLVGASAVGCHLLAAKRGPLLVAPDTVFSLFQSLMLIGSINLVDMQDGTDRLYAELLTYFVVAFAISATVIRDRLRLLRARSNVLVVLREGLTSHLWLLFGISVAVTAAYFVTVGYSAFLLGLSGMLGGSTYDITTLRLESYSGERYLAPGYVNQFKNSLLPVLAVAIAYSLWRSNTGKGRWFTISALGLVSVGGLVGTGQRGPFVLFVLILAVFGWWARRDLSLRMGLLASVFALAVFLLGTAVLDRGSGASDGNLAASAIGSALGQMYDRMLVSNQVAGIVGFRYVADLPAANGMEWFRAFTGLLPGRGGSTLAHETYLIMYGSSRGTAPPSLVGSIYHNFGTAGVLVAPPVLAFIAVCITNAIANVRHPTALQLMGMAGVTVVFGTWIAGSPTYLLESGVAVYALVWHLSSRSWGPGPAVLQAGSPALVTRRNLGFPVSRSLGQ